MTAPERAAALLAAGKLSTAQQVAAVERGWLNATDVSAAAQTAIKNLQAIRTQAAAAMTVNNQVITAADTYLALSAPTNAQVVAQVKALTTAAKIAAQQRNALIRLALNDLSGTS